MFNYMYITNSIEEALIAEGAGVQRIFIDLEMLGKVERQGHLDTVISRHTFSDIKDVSSVLKKSSTLVRLNPLYKGSYDEVQRAVDSGADIIMQPMCRTVEDVDNFSSFIPEGVKFMPLIETIGALNCLDEISRLSSVDELHIGLNDLHLDLGLKFMFEPMASGLIAEKIVSLDKPYGIGGVAKVGTGAVPGELVMAAHVYLGSSGVILSRSFKENVDNFECFKNEFEQLSHARGIALASDASVRKERFEDFVESVVGVVKSL